jgi:cytochrome P450
MEAYMDGVIDAHEADPSSEFFRLLIESEVDGQKLTRSEIRRLGMMIIATAGHETSASAMSMALYYLAGNPRALAALREDAQLMPTALEEMLRWTAPVQMFGRNTTREVELHGTTIPKGAAVAVTYGSANVDPEVFPDPYEVKLDRSPNRHLTFGVGPHFCVGAPIARLEMELLLSELSRRIERIDIAEEDELVWNPRVDRRGLWKLPATLVPLT